MSCVLPPPPSWEKAKKKGEKLTMIEREKVPLVMDDDLQSMPGWEAKAPNPPKLPKTFGLV